MGRVMQLQWGRDRQVADSPCNLVMLFDVLYCFNGAATVRSRIA